jgi:uncharacterized protein YjiS (DUF1127 family)
METPVHSSVQDLVLSDFTLREPVGSRSLWARLRTVAESLGERIAEWRLRIRTRNQLARLSDYDWSVGDYGIARWQAEAELRKLFWIN